MINLNLEQRLNCLNMQCALALHLYIRKVTQSVHLKLFYR